MRNMRLKSIKYILLFLLIISSEHLFAQLEYRGRYLYALANKSGVPMFGNSSLTRSLGTTMTEGELYLVYEESNADVLGLGTEDGSELEFYVRKSDVLMNKTLTGDWSALKTRNNISSKATVISPSDVSKVEPVHFYNSPTSNQPVGDLAFYEIYFVYDIYPSNISIDDIEDVRDNPNVRVLLGKNEIFNNRNTGEFSYKRALIGWTKINNLISWNTPTGLQPELSRDAKSQKLTSKQYGKIWESEPCAIEYAKRGTANTTFCSPTTVQFSDEAYVLDRQFKNQPNHYRMLVLERTPGNALRVAFVARRDGEQVKEQVQVIPKNIEILFVLDATSTMKNVGQGLLTAFGKAIQQIKRDYPSYDYRMGLAVFRNSKDRSGTSFPPYQWLGDTRDVNKFTTWLQGINFGSNSTNLEEDLFYATGKAMNTFWPTVDQTKDRFVFVITDVDGEERGGYNATTLANRLNNKQAHLGFINVKPNHAGSVMAQAKKIYNARYNHQLPLTKYEQSNKRKYYSAFLNTSGITPERSSLVVQCNFQGLSNFQMIQHYEVVLKDLIVSPFESYVRVASQTPGNGKPKLKVADIEIPWNVNPSYSRNATNDLGIYYNEGYVYNDYVKLNDNPFTPMILLSYIDVQRLRGFFQQLYSELQGRVNDQELDQATTKMLQYLGNTKSAYLEAVDQKRIYAKGLPEKTQFIKEMIENGTITKKSRLRELSAQFDDSALFFDEILSEMNRSVKDNSFIIGGTPYRWVPVEAIP